MIYFNCGSCGASLRISSDVVQPGYGTCPKCGFQTTINPSDNQPGPCEPQRTTKSTILFRIMIVPMIVMGFFTLITGVPAVFIGGVGFPLLLLLIWWAGVNLFSRCSNPEVYRAWKAGGGDPFFDTMMPPFNTDPDSVRYKELYELNLRQELGVGPPQAPPTSPDNIDLNNL